MSLRKKFYNPSDPKDAEELLNFLEQLSSDNDISINFISHYSHQKMEETVTKTTVQVKMMRCAELALKGEKQVLIGPGSRNFTTDSFSSEDEIPLAKLQSPKKKEQRQLQKEWKEVGIEKNRRKNNYR
ncbi:hypothetical protein HHI36_010536 [Cryptolaemus montrouzieri]|uniref:Uncharacterized protein n=1 Tax=Cryptolaemus montrouzieri TaxID=559131 RepID=A0ABD2MJ29_9CUCU